MDSYRDPETEDTLQRLETYRHYVERLDTLRNLNSITDEEYADLKKVVEDKVAELESRFFFGKED